MPQSNQERDFTRELKLKTACPPDTDDLVRTCIPGIRTRTAITSSY